MDTPDYKRRDAHRHRRSRTCCLVTLTAVIILFLLLLILFLTVLKPKHAVTTVDAIKLSGLRAGLDIPNLSVDINITLSLVVTAVNPNHASFRYPGGGTAELYYRGDLVGDAVIPPGEIKAKGTETIDVDLTVMAGKLIGDSNVYRDVIGGSLVLTTVTRISGRVTILGVVKHHLVSYTTCDVTVDIRDRSVKNSDCKYKTKL